MIYELPAAREFGQTSSQWGVGRGMISSGMRLKLCGWEIRDEGSGAA